LSFWSNHTSRGCIDLCVDKMESIFTAIFEKVGDWYIGYVEELAGAKQGKTLEEAQGESTRSYRIEKELSGNDFIREELNVAI